MHNLLQQPRAGLSKNRGLAPRLGLMTALYVARSVSFCLSHPVAVSVFIICSGWCACTEVL